MIYGIGIDIVYIPRIKKIIERWGEHFKNRVFTPNEILPRLKKKTLYQELATRIAAKEAFAKAVGLGWRKGLKWRDIEIINLKSGQPIINLYGKALEICKQVGIKNIFVSLSHEKDYAIAIVILEK
ncbi:MAG TPA: holo-ACP synthase [Candidatus Desulfofervidus auxilii]|uniref:Holo-[acyl-carrier-protein] synthase n=1 Tax=Desulfofervidus auxilii TaxID=1621989 RepID=A0A7C0Y184_DESA2|nr:holo-ACP synthase [Candidatus Desulfofervidus auxilii]